MTVGRDQQALEQQIKENLRRVFRDKAEEKVPDRFLDLLAQLRQHDEVKDGQ